ncbi:MAG: hypothetical protein JXR97_12005, partial [Planctomycetes bacterium]|nr:hypothetical protein [Planctomycetota bacterium]
MEEKIFDDINHFDSKRAGYIITGFVMALICVWVNILHVGLGGMAVLIHEMGHAIAGWLLGSASVPAFDFRYGGGVTMIPDPSTWIFVVIYCAFAYGFFALHKNFISLGVLVFLLIAYTIAAFTGLRGGIILAMGHGTEVIFSALFLYRAFTGKSVAHELERLAYALVGWFLVMHNVAFSWKL